MMNGTMVISVINGIMVGTVDDEWYNGKINGIMVGTVVGSLDDEWYNSKIIG